MLIQMGVRAAWTSLAIAITNGHAADDILALRTVRRATMRRNMSIRMLLTTRVCLLHRLYDAWCRLCAAIHK